MLTSLHTIVRFGILAFAGLSLAALTAAQLQPKSDEPGFAAGENPWEALCMEPGHDGSPIELVHRGEGRRRLLQVPAKARWEYMATSPRVALDGTMEAVGRFASSADGDSSHPEGTVGIFRVRLPQGEVLEKMDLQVMPTGRPAWDPTDDGHVIFPAASGGLYSYRFTPSAEAEEGGSSGSSIAALEWRCPRPEGTEAFIIDPVWLRQPELSKYLLVSMTPVRRPGELGPAPPIRPWWLELDDAREGIVAAGPLARPDDPAASQLAGRLRQPNVVEQDGSLRLYYARLDTTRTQVVICAAELELDPATARPRIRPGTAGPVCDSQFGYGPMVPSLDGRTAFLYSSAADRPNAFPLRLRPIGGDETSIDLAARR